MAAQPCASGNIFSLNMQFFSRNTLCFEEIHFQETFLQNIISRNTILTKNIKSIDNVVFKSVCQQQ